MHTHAPCTCTHTCKTHPLPDTPASLYACTQVTWVTLQEIVHQLDDEELGALDAYELANPNADWVDARRNCRAALAEASENG